MVFPAYAGMSPRQAIERTRINRFPRLRGDEPAPTVAHATRVKFSPPTRG